MRVSWPRRPGRSGRSTSRSDPWVQAGKALTSTPGFAADLRVRRSYPSAMDDESRLPRPPRADYPSAESRPLASVPDDDLLRRLDEILGQSRRVEADLVAHIAEVDERRLGRARRSPRCSPTARRLCTCRRARPTCASPPPEPRASIRWSWDAGRRAPPPERDRPARAPPHDREPETLLRRATHRSKRQIEEMIASVAPREDAPSLMRRLPARAAPATLTPGSDSILAAPEELARPSQLRPEWVVR